MKRFRSTTAMTAALSLTIAQALPTAGFAQDAELPNCELDGPVPCVTVEGETIETLEELDAAIADGLDLSLDGEMEAEGTLETEGSIVEGEATAEGEAETAADLEAELEAAEEEAAAAAAAEEEAAAAAAAEEEAAAAAAAEEEAAAAAAAEEEAAAAAAAEEEAAAQAAAEEAAAAAAEEAEAAAAAEAEAAAQAEADAAADAEAEAAAATAEAEMADETDLTEEAEVAPEAEVTEDGATDMTEETGTVDGEMDAEATAEADADVEAEAETDMAEETSTEDMTPEEIAAELEAEGAEEVEAASAEEQAEMEAEMAETDAASAAATADADAEAAEVTTTEVTEEDVRSSEEDFETQAAASGSASNDDDDDGGLSNFERALLVGLGAVAVGSILNNGDEVVSTSGDRVVVKRNGELTVLKDDDVLLRQPGANITTETFSDGSTRTTVVNPDGTEIVTVRAADGRVLRRDRILADGTTVQLFDDTRTVEPVQVSNLPAAQPSNDRNLSDADLEELRVALSASNAPNVGRTFSLRQVRQIERVRALAPVVTLDAVTFDTGSAAIGSAQAEALFDLGRAIEAVLDEDPGSVFLIEGHTDAVGDATYNLALSDRRAESVALALTEYFDIPPENLVTQGYGEAYLKVETLQDERANRRAAVRNITGLLRDI